MFLFLSKYENLTKKELTFAYSFGNILNTNILLRLNGDFLEHYFTNNEDLKSEIRTISYTYQNHEFIFLSDNGVFSKDKVDFGSRLLLETFLKNEKRKKIDILDVGCGYGFLGIVASFFLESSTTMCDINARAVHLAKRNIEKNKVNAIAKLSNIYENITDEFDVILTNPPIRAGKDTVLKILLDAKKYLKEKGHLWFVIRKDQGAKSILKEVEKSAKCEIIEKSKGFYVISSEFS